MKPKTNEAAKALEDLSLPDVVPGARLAEHLDLSRQTVCEHLRLGVLPGRKIGGRWYVTRRELLKFLEASPPLSFSRKQSKEVSR